MFTNTEGTTSPAVVLGANRSGSVDPKRGDFAGIVAHSYANPYSSTGIYSDKVYFDSHGGEPNTGGWTLENYRKSGKMRAFFGNNSVEYSYELGQANAQFYSVWTQGLNDKFKLVTYRSGNAVLTSWNGRYGIVISNHSVELLYNNAVYDVGNILQDSTWKV
ncbi:hypothetical protein KWC85_002149 [Staphylococcus pseudintermedius]|nr:hypothetical protein [Staphylococcus pseudintermedius]